VVKRPIRYFAMPPPKTDKAATLDAIEDRRATFKQFLPDLKISQPRGGGIKRRKIGSGIA
jgi:hypothetical protein